MAYNKAKAEREWRRWKETEEHKLRELGVDEETIQQDTESLLDSIEDTELLRVLSKEDKLTLQIILYKLQSYTSIEIAEKTGLTETAVRQRISRLKKKF